MCFDRWEHVEKDKYLLMQRIKRPYTFFEFFYKSMFAKF